MKWTFLSGVLRLDDPGQAKVCDLAVQGFVHQDVGRAHVPVDVVLLLDVGHALGYLPCSQAEEEFQAFFFFFEKKPKQRKA